MRDDIKKEIGHWGEALSCLAGKMKVIFAVNLRAGASRGLFKYFKAEFQIFKRHAEAVSV